MALKTKQQPLVIEGAPELRYRVLPALDVADYVQDYVERFNNTGVLDYLSISGSGVDQAALKARDLSAISVVVQAFARALSGDGGSSPLKIRDEIKDHAKRFDVQVKVDDAWESLDSDDMLNEHLGIVHMVDIVKTLARETLSPLWQRLACAGEAKPSESASGSPSQPKES